jgi:hypothetical protein
MDSLSKKLSSNDKTLEIINNRMDSFSFFWNWMDRFSTVIKNQLSFNKMLESQLQ